VYIYQSYYKNKLGGPFLLEHAVGLLLGAWPQIQFIVVVHVMQNCVTYQIAAL